MSEEQTLAAAAKRKLKPAVTVEPLGVFEITYPIEMDPKGCSADETPETDPSPSVIKP
jgi:hypothetical protein